MDIYNIEIDKEMVEFKKCINRFKEGDNVSYNELPNTVKYIIDNIYDNSSDMQTFVNSILELFINGVVFEEDTNEDNLLSDFMKVFIQILRHSSEEELINASNELEKINPALSKKIRNILNTVVKFYKFKIIIDISSNDFNISLDKDNYLIIINM